MIELLLEAERALSVGLLDRAETLYGHVVAADPRNSIAIVGLARVALDRGDELRALALSREALTIDPENAAAQRMVARLEEVIEYRGDVLPPATGEPGGHEPGSVAPEREPALSEPPPEPDPHASRDAAGEPDGASRTSVGTGAAETTAVDGLKAAHRPLEPEPVQRRRRSWLDRVLRRPR